MHAHTRTHTHTHTHTHTQNTTTTTITPFTLREHYSQKILENYVPNEHKVSILRRFLEKY